MKLEHSLERTLTILARRETVFRFFTDSERWARWWGAGSTVDPRPGGPIRILYPGASALRSLMDSRAARRFRRGHRA
jgi:uncharacterized protein YndB with AHSA1/START domain